MRHYDLHVTYEEGEFDKLVREAKLLGFSGLGVELPSKRAPELSAKVAGLCEAVNLECFVRIDVGELGALRDIVKRVGRGRVLVSYTHCGGKIDVSLARKADIIDLKGPVDGRSLRKVKNINPYVAFEIERRTLIELLTTNYEDLLDLLSSLRRVFRNKFQVVATSGAAKWYQLVPPAQLSYTVAALLGVEEKPRKFTQLALRTVLRLMEGGA